MNKKNYETLFMILILLGMVIALIPIFGLLQMRVVIPNSNSPVIEFTGFHATLFTIGILLIIIALIIKIKKLPKIKISIEK